MPIDSEHQRLALRIEDPTSYLLSRIVELQRKREQAVQNARRRSLSASKRLAKAEQRAEVAERNAARFHAMLIVERVAKTKSVA